ncbi:MAG: HAMP domain-containing histidine kinase [Deltaproteobacteria bacterium]|nr:HAMP domain-containing histidine kinase [Deltaproteobacteria bacterium]
MRHLGGGRKGLFLLLRYLFIIAASYILVFQGRPLVPAIHAASIAIALASNVFLSFVSEEVLFAWYVEAPVLIVDTLWVSWAIHSNGTVAGQEFFLLYFFVLFLAALGDSLPIVILGSTVVATANLVLSASADRWTTPSLLKLVFFYTVALFYGHVIAQTKRERQRADRGVAWARALEGKVADRTRELGRLYDESLAANNAKTEFIANMSHELRTPLNIILGYTELLLDHDGGPKIAEERDDMLRRIQLSAFGQIRLVDSVLDLGRIDAGTMPVDHFPVPLRRLIDEIQRSSQAPLKPGVDLKWELPTTSPLLETDPRKLSLVLGNLIDNALKFTHAGSITVAVRDLPQDRKVEFSVADTGPGIPASDLPSIFQPFVQLDDPANHHKGGAGLGLAVVDRYVRLLGGKISVESTMGRGSRFAVAFPYWTPTVDPKTAASIVQQSPLTIDAWGAQPAARALAEGVC